MDFLKNLLHDSSDWVIQKIGLLFVWLIMFFTPLVPTILIVTVFVAIDYLMGVQASRKQGIEITSRRRKDTVTKTLAYQLTLITAFFLEKFFIKDFPVLKLVSGFIVYVEVTSIDENNKIITGKSILKEILKHFKKLNSNDK